MAEGVAPGSSQCCGGKVAVAMHGDAGPPAAQHPLAWQGFQIGQQIRPDQYRAVAAAIRFAEAMRKKTKARL